MAERARKREKLLKKLGISPTKKMSQREKNKQVNDSVDDVVNE